MMMPTNFRNDDGVERDSLVLLVGRLGAEGRALASALQRTGYAIQWEPSAQTLSSLVRETPPAAILVACDNARDPFGVVRWLRSRREYAQALVFAMTRPGAALPVGEGVASGADDVINDPNHVEDVLDRVSSRIARARTAEERAYFDCVTMVRNRLFVRERLPGELTRALRRHGRAAFGVLDVEGLASIRDEDGRATADRALEVLSFALRSRLRDADLICRFDERTFVLLMPGLDPASASIALGPVGQHGSGLKGPASRLRVDRVFVDAPGDGLTVESLFDAAERRLAPPRAPARPQVAHA